MEKQFIVSPSPHIHSGESVSKLMYGVVLALMPALLVSVWFYGLPALLITAISIVSCMVFEYLIQRFLLKRQSTLMDGSAFLTGLLLAFNLPSNIPWVIVVIGALVAIGVGKMTFGGLGSNIFNPALVGRVFLLISFPVQMTSFPVPAGFASSYTDAVTGPTALSIMKEGLKAGKPVQELLGQLPAYSDMFLGKMGGSLGEVAAAALLLGLAYMLVRKIITWHIPVSILLTMTVFAGILWLADSTHNPNPLFHLLTGGALLGAVFMATDYVTSPMGGKGMIIYGIGIGLLTILIRTFGAYPEGISFAILIMNAFVPLINKYIKPKRFGEVIAHG